MPLRASLLGLVAAIAIAQAPPVPSGTIDLASLGAVGDGATDDSAAFQKAADLATSKGGLTIAAAPGKHYVLRQGVKLSGSFHLDLRGATLQPLGAINNLLYRAAPKDVPAAIVQGSDKGSASVLLQSAEGLKPGNLVRFSSTTAGGWLLPSYRTILRVQGNKVDLDAPLPYRYPAPAALHKADLSGAFILENGTVDGSGWTNPNAVVFVGGYDTVEVKGMTFTHCSGGSSNWLVPQVNRAVTVKGCHFLGNSVSVTGECINIWDSQKVTVVGNEIRGSGFGIAVTRGDEVLIEDNDICGDADIHPKISVRGIKLIGCYGALVRGNTIRDFANAIKAQDSGALRIERNTCLDVSPGDPTSYAIAVSNEHPDREHQGGHQILNNRVEGSGGNGIYLGLGSPGCVVEGNQIRGVGSFGIAVFTDEPGGHTIRGNTIDGFDLAGKGAVGIYLGASSECQENTISEATGRKPAIRVGVMGKASRITGNQTPRGNPLKEE